MAATQATTAVESAKATETTATKAANATEATNATEPTMMTDATSATKRMPKRGSGADRIIGTVTIGQSPRVDLIPEIEEVMGLRSGGHDGAHEGSQTDWPVAASATSGPGRPVRIVEAGALDGLTLDEVKDLAPGPGDYVLVTRMADGTSVKIAERHILQRMQEKIDWLSTQGADVIALVCTGEFPEFRCDRMLVVPQKLLHHVVSAVAGVRRAGDVRAFRLGVMLPDADQTEHGMRRWSTVTPEVRVEAASPYGDLSAVRQAAAALRRWGAEAVVMDCIGYTLAMKRLVAEETGSPVFLARSVLARVLAELVF